MEEECKDGFAIYPLLLKCIIFSGSHRADFNHCSLKSMNPKLKGSVKKAREPNVSQIRGYQKLIRKYAVRENRAQIEMEA